jgi:hypothetical protein
MTGDQTVTVRHLGPMLLRRRRKRIHGHWFVATDTPLMMRAGSPRNLAETHILGAHRLPWIEANYVASSIALIR